MIDKKETARIKDVILTQIVNSKKSLCIQEISNAIKIDFNTVFTLANDLSNSGLVRSDNASSIRGKEKILTITPEGIYFNQTTSHESIVENEILEKKGNERKIRRDWLTQILSVLLALIGLDWGIYKDTQSDKKDSKISNLEKEIKDLKSVTTPLQTQKRLKLP